MTKSIECIIAFYLMHTTQENRIFFAKQYLRDVVEEGVQWFNSMGSHVPELYDQLVLQFVINECHWYW